MPDSLLYAESVETLMSRGAYDRLERARRCSTLMTLVGRADLAALAGLPNHTYSGGVEDLWVLAFFCLPTAIDLALPVTGVHDFCVD